MYEIILIAAIGKNRELGKGPELIWRLPSDLKRFKELTTGHSLIMGRKTCDSIGRPLPNRTNIIVTRNTAYTQEGCAVAHSLEEAIEHARKAPGGEKIFIIGGGEIYKEALPFADTLELTLIEARDPKADIFFPEFENEFEKVSESEPHEENGVYFTWTSFKRKKHR